MSGSDPLTVLGPPFGMASLGLAPQEPSGPPTFSTLLSTHTTLSGGPRPILGDLTKAISLWWLLERYNHRHLHYCRLRGCIKLQGVRSPLRSTWCPVYASPVSFGLHLLHRRNTRYEWLVGPCSAGTCTLQETPSFAWRTNAKAHLLPEAGATQERRLLAVRCSAGLGWGRSGGLPGGCPPPRDAVTLVVLLEAPATLLPQCPAPTYLITSSTWKRTCGGIVRPRAFAVFKLRTSSNF